MQESAHLIPMTMHTGNELQEKPLQSWNTTNHRPSKSTIFFHAIPLLIASPLAIALFVLEQLSIRILNANRDAIEMNLNTRDNDTDWENGFTFWTIYIETLPTTLMIWTSLLTAMFSVIAGLALWEIRAAYDIPQRESRSRRWAWANIFVTLTNLVVVVGCTVVAFLAQKGDGNVDITDLNGVNPTWTRESLLCDLRGLEDSGTWANAGCGFARTGRYILIPLGVCSLALVSLCFRQIGQRGGLSWLVGGPCKNGKGKTTNGLGMEPQRQAGVA
ncbi:hypothetical protein K504DRAFT_458321 [Pleomassaria siparia CBS 279.74]|uniref:Uncharacterized protein n=1 Tax=Pleomassaria siparia CBS 279.74 TaxID=1314801 RepID=A0A6G1K4N4_9PLEO|nr:hypothetical protein K504DRAFT_458321 [Pleomassaria siparia CBS 279.74]